MSAEVDYLNQQVQSLKQELELQAALYLDKMNRHQRKAMWLIWTLGGTILCIAPYELMCTYIGAVYNM